MIETSTEPPVTAALLTDQPLDAWDDRTWRAAQNRVAADRMRGIPHWILWTAIGVLVPPGVLGNYWLLAVAFLAFLVIQGKLDPGAWTARVWSSWWSLLWATQSRLPLMEIHRDAQASLPRGPANLPRLLRRLEREADAVRSARSDAPDIVHFTIDDKPWAARLLPHGAVVAATRGGEWQIVARTSFDEQPGDLDGLDEHGEPYLLLRFGEWTPRARVPSADLSRLRAWKERGAQSPS